MKMYKTCKNDSCDKMNVKFKCSNTDKFCIKCGSPLVHICYTCLEPLESDTAKYCTSCLEQQQLKRQERKDAMNSGIQKVPEAAAGIVAVAPVIAKAAKKIITKK